MFLSNKWKAYELIDASDGEKLERWGDVLVIRPDPQVVWTQRNKSPLWQKAHMKYIRSSSGGGRWETPGATPSSWTISYNSLNFGIRPMGFKHMGLFPEQADNWDWFSNIIASSNDENVKVLNLFAYTGGATVAAAKAGASVCHVDSAKGMVAYAKENSLLSGLADRPIRYIVDDVKKFVQREIRRGSVYHGVIMDPPSYGRGPKGETWKLEDELFGLVKDCMKILNDCPLFFLINTYTTGLSGGVMDNIMKLTLQKKYGGVTDISEIGLPITTENLYLPCGYSTRWTNRVYPTK